MAAPEDEEEPLLPRPDDPGPTSSPPDPAPQIPPPTPELPPETQRSQWRNRAAFWLLGLCTNLPYVLLLSAAHDLLTPAQPPTEAPPPSNGSRRCNPLSTGAVLLADIIPGLGVKLLAPLLLPLPCHVRVVAAALGSWGSFSLVVSAKGVATALGGVALGSAAMGLGEVTLLPLAGEYPGAGLWGWAAGTGVAGVGGALAYGALRGEGLPPPLALLPPLALPPTLMASYFFLLGPPPPPQGPTPPPPPDTAAHKWRLAKFSLWEATPLGIVYFAEYFINQGLLELLYFPSHPAQAAQYRWFQVLYQAGVCVARSCPSHLLPRRVWALALLQVLNAALLLAAVVVPILPGPAAAFALIGWEGLVGGGAFVGTFLNVAEKAPEGSRAWCLSVAAVSDSLGVALAGGASLGIHSILCPTA